MGLTLNSSYSYFTFGQNQSIADRQVYKVIYQSHQLLLCSMNPALAISKFVNVAKLVRYVSQNTFLLPKLPSLMELPNPKIGKVDSTLVIMPFEGLYSNSRVRFRLSLIGLDRTGS